MIKAVIFDIGGVLAYDVWEGILLDPQEGLAVRWALDPQAVTQTALVLWKRYAYRSAADWQTLEMDYWADFKQMTGCPAPIPDILQLTERFIRPVPGSMALVKRLKAQGVPLGVCSNNTEFWYARQARLLDLTRCVPAQCIVLSNRSGVSKTRPGHLMFQQVTSAVGVDKSECLFIDDQPESIESSLQFGMPGILFPAHAAWGACYIEALLQQMNILQDGG